MVRRLSIVIAAAVAAIALPMTLNGQWTGTFAPDWTFTGSSLDGMQQIGQVTWRAENGEIIATPTAPEGGWLLLGKGYQDVQFAGSFRCAGQCTAGIMLRSEQTPAGLKGLFAQIAGGEREAAAVTVDAQGKVVNREPLDRSAGGQARFAPPPPDPAAQARGGRGRRAGGGGRGGRGGAGGEAPAFTSMFPPAPSSDFRPNDWNRVETIADVNLFKFGVNSTGLTGRAVDAETGNFGPVALYVGGSGEVRFRDLALKDLNRRLTPAEVVSSHFKMQRIEDFYYGWSMAAGDFNDDGTLDVTVANRYYLGPDFTASHEVYGAQPFNPAKEYSPAMVNFAFDYTGDGWDDILVAESRAPALYVNPKGESRRWTRHTVSPAVISEAITFKDINADGMPDPVFAGGGVVQWITPDPANPTAPWKVYAVSTPGPATASVHGIGAGDVNGDGKMDIVMAHGWWEQPAAGATQVPWTFHQAAFGRGGNAGGEIEVFDVNGDGAPDVVTALSAHGFGLAWYEQKRPTSGSGESTWVEHLIMGDFASENAGDVVFTEPHALTAADVDGDGIKDIVTGKRHWAHLESYSDPDPMGPAVLYWFRTVRNAGAPGGAEFVPELIHNRSGVGSMVQTADLNEDGNVDIMVGTNRGNFIFWGQR